ncbi:class I SAM-dependent methyltransferase [Pyxidicoccus caerfyrddinensis]|uniref:class I SAM-dependent methyltransferase n=1 Tax=Pyxidicoccus caerfyrddinensis TaxID=2709663 RepID=UPI0013DD508D|nr:class I SAM-dependent methyltransferase [Pyxidicoccus caerfyrddinensis]
MNLEAFFTLYNDLPQFGPGSVACTLEALKRLPTLPPAPRVVDVGCGSGRQTLVLAEALLTRILAVDPRPAEAARFWTEGYPTMGTTPRNRATAEAEGYEVLDTFTLPHSAWWDYYTPLLQRMERLHPTADPALREVFTATEEEIALFRPHGDSYGYVFYLLRNRAT